MSRDPRDSHPRLEPTAPVALNSTSASTSTPFPVPVVHPQDPLVSLFPSATLCPPTRLLARPTPPTTEPQPCRGLIVRTGGKVEESPHPRERGHCPLLLAHTPPLRHLSSSSSAPTVPHHRRADHVVRLPLPCLPYPGHSLSSASLSPTLGVLTLAPRNHSCLPTLHSPLLLAHPPSPLPLRQVRLQPP